jgi:hypothetical protein
LRHPFPPNRASVSPPISPIAPGCRAYLRELRITPDIDHTVADREPVVPSTLLAAFPDRRDTGDADSDDR